MFRSGSSIIHARNSDDNCINANLIASSEIIMAPIWSYLIFHETIGKWAAVGAVLMVGAILYETLFEARNEAEK